MTQQCARETNAQWNLGLKKVKLLCVPRELV